VTGKKISYHCSLCYKHGERRERERQELFSQEEGWKKITKILEFLS
jgi:hypothetical protein